MGALAGPLTSIVGSLMLGASGIAIGWLSKNNLIPAADVNADTVALSTYLTTGALAAVGVGVMWFKGMMSTKVAHIEAVNSGDNGVKVVADTVVAPKVTVPLK